MIYSYKATIILEVNSTISTGINKLETNFIIFPNPAHNFLNIELLNNKIHSEIQILDISGRLIKTNKVEQSLAINISDLEEGVYFIKIDSTILKFIKK